MLSNTSITEFLDEILNIKSDSKAKGPDNAAQKKQFIVRAASIQTWFIRCSWLEKVDFLKQLLRGLKNIESLRTIVKTIEKVLLKSSIYAQTQLTTNFVYDKILQDHNRALREETLIETEDADLDWFGLLDDKEQVMVAIGLLRLGGGSILYKIHGIAKKILIKRELKSLEQPQTTLAFDLELEAAYADNNAEIKYPPELIKCASGTLTSKTQLTFDFQYNTETEFESYDPKNPLLLDVQKCRKDWNELITKYKKEVDGKPPSTPKSSKDKKGKGKNSKDTSKNKKSGKSSKSSKSSKTGKSKKTKKGKQVEEIDRGDHIIDAYTQVYFLPSSPLQLDKIEEKVYKVLKRWEIVPWVQLLPVWIVKKIFGYLDTKTLKKVKEVNSYWEYVVADLQKELKTRKTLDKFIMKLEDDIEDFEGPCEKPVISKYDKFEYVDKERIRKLNNRGAICNSLKKELQFKHLNENSVSKTTRQVIADYILPIKDLQLFPRILSPRETLYKAPACLISELGFIKQSVDEDNINSEFDI